MPRSGMKMFLAFTLLVVVVSLTSLLVWSFFVVGFGDPVETSVEPTTRETYGSYSATDTLPPNCSYWIVEFVDGGVLDRGRYASLASVGGQPAIAHADDIGAMELVYSARTAGVWNTSLVDAVSADYKAVSLTVVAGVPVIAAFSDALGELYFFELPATTWIKKKLVGPSLGDECSIADINGEPGIAYQDPVNGDLWYISRAGVAWTPGIVDNSENVVDGISLALVAGQPAISYRDSVAGLKYARYDGAIWILEIVDAGAEFGKFSSLTSVAGKPVVAYYDEVAGDLKIARWNGAAWIKEFVATTLDVGEYCSIVALGGTRLAVSYQFNDVASELRFAIEPVPWTLETVVPGPDTGKYSSIAAVDSSVGIAFKDRLTNDLMFAQREPGCFP